MHPLLLLSFVTVQLVLPAWGEYRVTPSYGQPLEYLANTTFTKLALGSTPS